MDSIFDEMEYGVLRKDAEGSIVYTNEYLKKKPNLEKYLSKVYLKESNVESGLFFVNDHIPVSDILDNIDIGVYKKVNDYVVYINKFLTDLGIEDIHSIDDYIMEHENYSELKVQDKSYFMSRTNVCDYNLLHDKTELIELEKRLGVIKELLSIHYIEKENFISNITRDLKTPLSSIISLLTLMSTTTSINQIQRYMSMMKECSYNLLEIVNHILDYTKLEIGNIVLNNESLDIRQVVKEISSISKEMIKNKQVKLDTFVSIDVPEVIQMDKKLLKQVLLNILSHSLLYTDSGSIELSINRISKERYIQAMKVLKKCKVCHNYACHICQNGMNCYCDNQRCICCNKTSSTQPSVYLQIEIIDTGLIVENQKKEIMFSNEYNENYVGLLGLYIAHKLVFLMDGNLMIDKERMIGNRYSFVVKVQQDAVDSVILSNIVKLYI